MPKVFAATIAEHDDYNNFCLGIAATREGALALVAAHAREIHSQVNGSDLPLSEDDQAAVDYFFGDDFASESYGINEVEVPADVLHQLTAQGD